MDNLVSCVHYIINVMSALISVTAAVLLSIVKLGKAVQMFQVKLQLNAINKQL